MLFAIGALTSALDALQSMTSSKSSPPSAGFGLGATGSFDPTAGASRSASSSPASGLGRGAQISPETMSALLAAQSQSTGGAAPAAQTNPVDALKHLFSLIDGDGDGRVSKSEFESALGAGGTNLAQADSVFNKFDANGDGFVSLDEMSSVLMGGRHQRHHQAASSNGVGDATGSGGSSSDPLLQALQGASSTSVTNSDGSTTTTVTYADGSKVTMSALASATGPGSASLSYNFVERLIQRQAQAITSSAAKPLSLSV